MRALIDATAQAAPAPLSDDWAFKIYLHDADYRNATDRAIEAAFGPGCQSLYLRGDLCRSGLLLEIEAYQHSTLPTAR